MLAHVIWFSISVLVNYFTWLLKKIKKRNRRRTVETKNRRLNSTLVPGHALRADSRQLRPQERRDWPARQTAGCFTRRVYNVQAQAATTHRATHHLLPRFDHDEAKRSDDHLHEFRAPSAPSQWRRVSSRCRAPPAWTGAPLPRAGPPPRALRRLLRLRRLIR